MSNYEARELAPYLGGSTEPWAASVVAALARVSRATRILELGTYEARTTAGLVEIAPVTTVDIEQRWENLPEGARFIKSDAVEFLKGCAMGSFDFVFVDDDHSQAHVEEELKLLYGDIVAPGGLIVLHDVIGPFGLEELVTSRGGFVIELPLLHVAGGLGVIQV